MDPEEFDQADGLKKELSDLLNKYSLENESNTPDFLMASFMLQCLSAYHEAVHNRDIWYGISPEPGKPSTERG